MMSPNEAAALTSFLLLVGRRRPGLNPKNRVREAPKVKDA
jgi:hypothetical protein